MKSENEKISVAFASAAAICVISKEKQFNVKPDYFPCFYFSFISKKEEKEQFPLFFFLNLPAYSIAVGYNL